MMLKGENLEPGKEGPESPRRDENSGGPSGGGSRRKGRCKRWSR